MVPFTDLTKDDLQSILTAFSSSTAFTKEQLEDIVQSLALCHLKSLIDFPLFGEELDRALDMDFGMNNRTTAAKLMPTALLKRLKLIP